MSSQATPYWQAVKQIREQLPEVVFITSLDDPLRGQVGGRVVAADRNVAAQRLVERSHKLSTPEEIAADKAAMDERSRLCAETEFRRRMEKSGPVIQLSDEQAVRLGAIPGQPAAPAASNGGNKKGAS